MISSPLKRLLVVTAALAFPALLGFVVEPSGGDSGSAPFARNRYVGAKACKNCHSAETKGDQYHKWENSEHAKAFAVLASAEAKAVAAKAGVKDPQKDPKCLVCHVTAHGEKTRMIKKGFKAELGVQCESCHGPGEQHAKARFAAASEAGEESAARLDIPQDEIIRAPGPDSCLKCHNDDSPTFKPFCFKERNEVIAHLDPRRKRTEAELAARKCQCGEKCECKHADCSEPGDKKAGDKKAGDKKTGDNKTGDSKTGDAKE